MHLLPRGHPRDPGAVPSTAEAQLARLRPELESALASGTEWRDVVETLPQIVWIARPDGYHVYFNQQWMEFTGLSLEESLGDGWSPPFHPDERARARRRWASATRTGQPYEIEYRLRRHDGVYCWMLGRAMPLRNTAGEIVSWFGTCTDIGAIKTALEDAAELRKELERRALHDSLTGLANRELLVEQMELMRRQRRPGGIAVVYVDLDRLKAVNDRLGHRVGDQLIVHVADCLRAAMRQGDVVARVGGDEFVVVGEVDDAMDAQSFGQRIVEAMDGRIQLEGQQVDVAASVGVSYLERGDSPGVDLALSLADERMYEAKQHRYAPVETSAGPLLVDSASGASPPDAAPSAASHILEALDLLPDAFMLLDVLGFVTWASAATSEVLGWPPSELVGRSIAVLALGENAGQQRQLLEEVRRTGTAVSVSTQRRSGDGPVIEVSVSVAPLRDSASGELAGFYGTVRSATHQSTLQAQLSQQEHVSVALNRRSSDVAIIAHLDTEITYISPSVVDVLGFTPGQLVGSKGLGLVHEDDLDAVTAFVGRVASSPDAVERLTFRVADAEAEWVWIEQTLTNCINVPGVHGLVANLRDVTSEVEARAALFASERRYRTIVETAQEGVLVLDHDTAILFANDKAAEMLGLARITLERSRLTALLDSASSEELRRRQLSRSRGGHERYEITYAHPDGRGRVFEVAASPMSLNAEGATGSLAMLSDVTDARRIASELQHRALHDALTGLPNRALLDDRLAMALSRQTRAADHPSVAVLFIGLDGFKLINDVYGRDASDAILFLVARRLRAAAPMADTVAHVGSDEFVVVAEGVDAAVAVALADRMRKAVLEPIVTDSAPVYVDASFGIAIAPPQAPSSLLRFASAALSQAKAQGRGRVHVYDASSNADVVTARRLDVANALREALDGDGLTLGYQPIVDLDHGSVVAVEALLRWEHPDLGPVPPSEVVATALAVGMAERLDEWVLHRACIDLTTIRSHGVGADIALAVNLSAESFSRRLPALVGDTSRLAGWPLDQLSLEITESALMGDPAAAATVVARLRELGVSVAIDDFGTGYSSLAYLKRLPVATLKVDRSFVEGLPADPESCAIVRSIADLARALSLTLVAEGIETQEQADHMRRLGCVRGQGFLWSPAVPPTELEELLRSWPG